MTRENPSRVQRLRGLKLIPRSKRWAVISLGILLGIILFSSISHSGSFGRNFLFYFLFFVLWPLCVFLIWIGFEVVKYLIVGAIVVPGAIAVLSYLGGNNETAFAAGAIAAAVLIVVLAIAAIIVGIFLGPGILVGLGIYYSLGSTFWSGLLGLLAGLIVYGLTYIILGKILIPFSFGFGTTMLGGIIASDISNAVFRVHQIYLLNVNINRFYKQISKSIDLNTVQSAIKSIYGTLSELMGGFGAGNWIIILGAFAVGIAFVLSGFRDLKKSVS